MSTEGRPQAIGATLAHYTILAKLGSGGMADVYLAEDTKLDRKVALKVLPPELAANDDRRARFAREAKAIAALNHPNIVTVHSVEEAEGVHFITMELVKGKTLAASLPRHGLSLARFFEIAIPLTEALAAAHQQGITHRDLKPANVMIGDDGRVKVLDFGLAKTEFPSLGRDHTLSTLSATEAGIVVGTPAYMSPEQAQGMPVDQRSDIFSLGIILYEMLTGARPFGSDVGSVLSILRDAPRPIRDVRPDIPRQLARVVHRCLEKAPLGRYQSVIDLQHDLEDARRDFESGDAGSADISPSAGRRSPKVPLAVLASVLVALTVGAWLFRGREGTGGSAVTRLQNPLQVTSTLDVESYPTWSPDGTRLAYQASAAGYYYIGNHDIWVAQLGRGEPVNLTKDSPANDRMPSWSPDGREIAFFSDRESGWGVYTVPAIGGNARRVLALQEPGSLNWSAPQWSADGSTLIVSWRQADTQQNVVIELSLRSLEPTRVLLPDHDGSVCWDLSVSPDGRRFAYLVGGSGQTEVTRLWTIASSGGEAVPLTDGLTDVWSPTWSKDGRKIFYVSNRGGSMDLWQQAVTADGNADGEPFAVTQGLGIRSAVFSPDGARLAYGRGGRVANVWRVPILTDRPATWADAVQLTSEHAFIEYVDVSPDGLRLAVSWNRRGNQDLWVLSVAGGEMTQLTTDPTPDWYPRWSPEGSEIAFYAYRSGNRDIWVMPSRGGPARQLTSHPRTEWQPSWSPDGREIAFGSAGPVSSWIVGAKGGEPRLLAAGFGAGVWSPDGQWLLVARQGRLHRLSSAGGEPVPLPAIPHQPSQRRFSRDGRSIYYSVITGPREDHDIWRLSLDDGRISRLTQLAGRRGEMGDGLATDGRHLYFTWREDEGDIWVMDVVR